MKKNAWVLAIGIGFSLLLSTNIVFANTGSARVLYTTNGVSSVPALNIYGRLGNAGYTSVSTANPNKSTWAVICCGIHKVVYSSSHGSANGIIGCSDGNLNVSTIVSSSVGFIYLSACHSAAPANSSSSARGHMYSVGVPMTVGFKSTVGADDDYYGELSGL